MASAHRKFNPGFLSDEEIVESFCVRTAHLELLLQSLRECTRLPNKHQLVIGPRGSGKTTLLLRVAAEIRCADDLNQRFLPVTFAEETYEVSTLAEFWLEGLSRLADQVSEQEAQELRTSLEELWAATDEKAVELRCLAVLQNYADKVDKRLVLIVENLHMVLQAMTRHAAWRLRYTLQTDHRIVLVASAPARFDEIDHPDHALYFQFRHLFLAPLDTDACLTLWTSVSGQARPRETIQALRILTGGNARLISIVAQYSAGHSFRGLMSGLLDLVDDHTEYFKSHLEALPHQERRVYLALADLWKPATTREIATRARLDTSKCSAQLARLVERGSVDAVGGSLRRKEYYLTERLYNIYYLLRRSRGQARMVEALIQFMEAFYSPSELRDIAGQIPQDLHDIDDQTRAAMRMAFKSLVALPALSKFRRELVMVAQEVSTLAGTDHEAMFNEIIKLIDQERPMDTLKLVDELLADIEEGTEIWLSALALGTKVPLLMQLLRYEETIVACDHLLDVVTSSDLPDRFDYVAEANLSKGLVQAELGWNEAALESLDKVALVIDSEDSSGKQKDLAQQALVTAANLHLVDNNPTKAIELLDRALGTGRLGFEGVAFVGFLVRARAYLTIREVTRCQADIVTALEGVIGSLILNGANLPLLLEFAALLDPAWLIETFQSSPASGQLLPLTTALELDLGREVRVASEVMEVAEDLREHLRRLRTHERLDRATDG